MIKKSFLTLALIALVGVTGLFANGAAEKSSSKATLTVWDFKYGEVDVSQKPMKQIDALFMQKYPDVTIDHVAQPGEPQYYQIIQAAAGANQGPDVAMFHPGAREYGFGDILVDLTPYISDVKDQFTAASIKMVSMNGQVGQPIKLLPMTMQGFGFYYNKDYFKKAGLDPEQPPKTASQFLAAAEKLKAAGIVPITVGQTYTIDFILRTLVANEFGPNVAGLKDGSVKFTDPQFKEGVEFVKTLVDKGYLEKDGFSRPYFMDGIEKYAAGGGAIFAGLLSDVGNWKAFSDKLGANNVGYFPTINFPDNKYQDRQVAQGAGIGYGVLKWSKNQKAAVDYVKFYATGDAARIYATGTGALSPNTAVTGVEQDYPALKVIQQYLKGNIVEDYIPMFYNGYEDDANRLCDQLFVTGQITPNQFIAEYQKLITKK
ncbi:MAG TPA: extracellular solute-binding protein [Spirochaetia bacterium]|nr:extracellular solute-binding protein [Spirochaetia bacterium]